MRFTFAIATFSLLTLAYASDLTVDPSGLWKPLPAMYKIHSGIVANRTPPTATDRKLTFHVEGKAAKEIFDAIGPDVEPTCNGEKGERERRRKGIYCTYYPPDQKAKGGPYRCWVGVDLITGEAETNVSC